jgi:DNA-binding MarR family transcriptional regulator
MTPLPRSLKVAVLREEFVALTGDAFQAIVLNQFIYWVQKVADFDDFIREEQERNPDCNVSLRHGWIYKKAQELIEETMLQMSENTMRRILKTLIEKGWVEERTNPDNRWNKVLQYRPDLKKIQQDLYCLGYALPGFPLLQPAENPNRHFDASRRQFEASNLQTERFILKDSKITPEITAKKSADTREDFSKSMLEIWNRLLSPPVPVQMTAERSQGLTTALAEHFKNKPELWSSFCQEITQSSFLMGKGQRGWRVTLDWILDSRNLQKTLEGNYRDADASPASSVPEKLSSQELKLKIDQHLESLDHPLFRQFCRALLRYLPEQKVLFWFGDAALSGWEDSRLVLSFPSRAARDYVERHFSSEMGSAARSICPDLKTLTLMVQQGIQASSCQAPSEMNSSPMTNSPAPLYVKNEPPM